MTAGANRTCVQCDHVRTNDRQRYVCTHPVVVASSARAFGRREPVSISYARDGDALCGPRGLLWRPIPVYGEGRCP